VSRESAHPYKRKTVTKEIYIKGASSLNIDFSEETKLADKDFLLFSYDKAGENIANTAGVGQESKNAGWQENPKGPDIAFSNELRTVTRTNSSSWGCAVWEEAYSSGKVHITFHLDADGGSDYLYIGCFNSATNLN
jgi:hypothetical protein